MHELSLTEKLLKLVLTVAEKNQARKITKVRVVIGELSGIVEDCVAYYFKLIAENTPAAWAKLEFTKSVARLYCPACQKEFIKNPRDFACPECGGLGRLTGEGRECFVESIEVE